MPTYAYKCIDCETKYEVFQKSIESQVSTACPMCSSENSKKLVTAANFNGFNSGKNYTLPQAPSCASGMCGLN